MNNLIQLETIQSLLNIGGKEFTVEMIEIYTSNIFIWVEELKQFIEHKNWELARKKAHLIKGASLNIGAEAVKICAFKIETELSESNFNDAILSFANFKTLCEDTVNELNKTKSNL